MCVSQLQAQNTKGKELTGLRTAYKYLVIMSVSSGLGSAVLATHISKGDRVVNEGAQCGPPCTPPPSSSPGRKPRVMTESGNERWNHRQGTNQSQSRIHLLFSSTFFLFFCGILFFTNTIQQVLHMEIMQDCETVFKKSPKILLVLKS